MRDADLAAECRRAIAAGLLCVDTAAGVELASRINGRPLSIRPRFPKE